MKLNINSYNNTVDKKGDKGWKLMIRGSYKSKVFTLNSFV